MALVPLALLIGAVRFSGLLEGFEVERLRAELQAYGGWAVVPFVVLYGVGIVAQIPGSVFVGAAVLAYGPVVGCAIAYAGALWGNTLSFGLVRWTGFRPLRAVQWPILSSLMRRLDAHPTSAITVIRVVFPSTAPVNYVLAMAGVGWRPFLVGSAIGVWPQLIGTAALFGALFE